RIWVRRTDRDSDRATRPPSPAAPALGPPVAEPRPARRARNPGGRGPTDGCLTSGCFPAGRCGDPLRRRRSTGAIMPSLTPRREPPGHGLQAVLRCAMLRGTNPSSNCSMASTRIIKKYPNRRLYDTEISSYITIEDVRQLIVDGEEVEVRDAKSGDDLTRSALLPRIAAHASDGEPVLSAQLLSQTSRFYGDSMQGFMGSYLERSMQVFLAQQAQFRPQMGGMLGQTPW